MSAVSGDLLNGSVPSLEEEEVGGREGGGGGGGGGREERGRGEMGSIEMFQEKYCFCLRAIVCS